MATNADFDALIVRIDNATTTLENSVDAVANGASDIEEAVIEAKGFATTATQQATQATNAANAAATASANAQTQANRAQGIADSLLATAPFQEAPQDGLTYGRNNADWVVVAGGGGEGTVTSVNNIAPDTEGNVTLSASDVGAKPSSYVPTWSEVSGKPTVYPTNWANVADKPTTFEPSAHTHAASDVTSGTFTVARIPSLNTSKITTGVFDTARLGTGTADSTKVLYGDGTWKEAPSGGGNTEVGVTFTYDGVTRTDWPVADRFEAIDLSLVTVNAVTGGNLFASTGTLNTMPIGKYYFGPSTFPSGNPLSGQLGVITVEKASATQKRAWAFVQAITGDTAGKMYVHRGSDGTWLRV